MEQQEQVEWDDVNRLLQHHGFKPVCFADPVENKNLSDLVLLGKGSAAEIRATLRTMLMDSERRQALIQELIKSNKQLKDEVQEHMRAAAQQSQRASELERLLEQVKVRVQELEERYLGKVVQHGGQLQQLEQDKEEAQKRCEALVLKLSREKEKSAQLQRKLYFTIKEEERSRSARRHDSAADQGYFRGESDPKHTTRTCNNAASSFGTILKAFEEQQRESRGQIEELKKEMAQLKQEAPTETTVKEARLNKHTMCGVEGLKRRSKTRLFREEQPTDPARLCAHYHNLLTEVSAMVMGPCADKPDAVGPDVNGFDGVLSRLGVWSQQLHLLKQALRRLAARLFPGRLCDGVDNGAGGVKVEDMVLLVDTMLEEMSPPDEKGLCTPTSFTLGAMVSHFQKLFDVTSLSGVYPRMSEVYTRLGEMSTAMKNLRDILDLDSRASAAQVVQHVSQLASSGGRRSKADETLGDADIDSIMVKVKQHDEFFRPFQMLVMDMFQILGVSRLDEVLPAVRTLKRSAH